MNKIKIYAAGAISNTTFGGATSWYQRLHQELDARYKILRPMRGKEFLEHNVPSYQELGANGDHSDHHDDHIEQEALTNRAIMGRDAWDVSRCDAVFMNLLETPRKVSVGCMMELGMAYAYRKPVVLVTDVSDEAMWKHPMVQHTVTFQASKFEDGILYLRSLFCDD